MCHDELWWEIDPDPRPRRESPMDDAGLAAAARLSGCAAGSTPANPFQALMECAPGDEPRIDKESLMELGDLLADAVDGLPEKERWVFEAHHFSGWSFRKIASMMGLKDHHSTWDVYQSAVARLRAQLTGDVVVERWLNDET